MTAIKIKTEEKTILNFSDIKYSRTKIATSLRKAEVIRVKPNDKGNGIIIINHTIKVGMYSIKLNLPPDSYPNWKKLSDYHDFEIHIYDSKALNEPYIDL